MIYKEYLEYIYYYLHLHTYQCVIIVIKDLCMNKIVL